MDVYDVVKKLIGGIEPVGSSEIDEKKYKNLGDTIDLVNRLIEDIQTVRSYKDCLEYSMRIAGNKADEFLKELWECGLDYYG